MATIKDVAKKAKVSIGTVDRVVHNRGRVSKKTIERVRKIIAELGYRPNLYARHLSLSKSYTIAVLMPKSDQDSGYWQISVSGIKAAISELKQHHVRLRLFQYDRYSSESFVNESRALLKSKPDGIMVAPVIWKGVREFFSEIPEKTPYVLFNTNVPDLKAVSFIGQDAYQSGVVCARLMSMVIGSGGTIAVVLPAFDDHHITERADGFRHFFEKYDSIALKTFSLSGQANEKNFDALLSGMFKTEENVRGIYVANASTHFVARYLKKRTDTNKIFLVGYDIIDKNIEYLKEGWIDVLISQKARMQGYEGVYALYSEVVLQQQCERNILMPIDIVVKENFVYYQ
jgi:LacI family transcriptional regulator